MTLMRRAGLSALVILVCAGWPAFAQPFEQSGVRAQGLAGAFVAVADDASAVWWNPAGLASGPFFNLLLEHQRQADPRERVSAFSVATPPLGLSYQRLRDDRAPAASTPTGRETESGDQPAGSLVTHEIGLTVLHSVTSGFVVGSTLKFVRGVIGDRGTSRVGLDLGVHYRVGALRAGLVARNVTEPSFQRPEGGTLKQGRQVRGGIAWMAEGSTTLAADVDLTDVRGTRPGRRVAIGAEHEWRRRVAARGGVRFRTANGADPWVSLGGSYAVKPGVWMDGFWGRSQDQDARWGVSARIAY
jgi:hypothetical protein